jgi:truncated hemoglobin YjbI
LNHFSLSKKQERQNMRRRERENWAKCLPATAARVAAVVAANKIRMEHRNFMIDGRNKFANQKH